MRSKVILDINGKDVEAIEENRWEDDVNVYVEYLIPSWNDYHTAPYVYPKGIGDVSGIESMSGMPKDYADKMLDSFEWGYYPGHDTQKQQNIVNEFLFSFDIMLRENVGLYLYSKTRGSGKTLLACAVGNEIIRHRALNVKFCSVTTYIDAYRNRAGRQYSDATVLILDDIGAQDDGKDWINEIVYGLINYRKEHNKLTIFTSNVPINQCSKDDRVTSRVEQMAVAVPIPEVPVRTKQAQLRKEKLFESLQVAPF